MWKILLCDLQEKAAVSKDIMRMEDSTEDLRR